MNELEKRIKKLFNQTFEAKIKKISLLPQSGSYRKYFRILTDNLSVIATYGENIDENKAFIHFTKNFLTKNLNVPKIYAVESSYKLYLQEDLGDNLLINILPELKKEEKIKIYEKIIDELIKFQTLGLENLDLNYCYQSKIFDKQAILWDLNYFKYLVLKVLKIEYNDSKLEAEFEKLSDFLTTADLNFFMYRDFQSANIIIKNEIPYFIDYQSGRKGAIFYDLASLLYDSKAKLSEDCKKILAKKYYEKIKNIIKISESEFFKFYDGYIFIRIIQAFAAYIFRGKIEKKIRFIKSIPLGIKNLKNFLQKNFLNDYPYLKLLIEQLTNLKELQTEDFSTITVEINSFSFHYNGYPKNEENGGGFVYDCRLLPNPGRLEKYKNLTGLDSEVQDFLNKETEVETFLSNVYEQILQTLRNYKSKGYNSLQVNFGCTGGQHRSVYCAEKLAEFLKQTTNVKIKVNHLNIKA